MSPPKVRLESQRNPFLLLMLKGFDVCRNSFERRDFKINFLARKRLRISGEGYNRSPGSIIRQANGLCDIAEHGGDVRDWILRKWWRFESLNQFQP